MNEFQIEHIDLFNDWSNLIKTELDEQLFNTNGLNEDEISILYFSNRKKIIDPKKRTIFKSDIFNCPSEHQLGLELIESKLTKGELLRPFQSRQLKKLKTKDGLLFDWGIYHLHLGTEIQSDGFIERTGPLLYLIIDDFNAYFIDVLNHGEWTNQELLRIIHRNWPQTIESSRIKGKGIVGLEKNFSDEEINQLRRANVNVLIEIEPGVIYIGPGGGVAGNGQSAEAVNAYIENRNNLKRLEDQIIKNTSDFLKQVFTNLDFIKNKKLNFRMEKGLLSHEILEVNNGFRIILNR